MATIWRIECASGGHFCVCLGCLQQRLRRTRLWPLINDHYGFAQGNLVCVLYFRRLSMPCNCSVRGLGSVAVHVWRCMCGMQQTTVITNGKH